MWLCGQILATHYRAPRAMHCRPSYSPPRPSSSCSPIPPPHTVARRHHTANLPPFLRTTMVSHPHGPQHRRRHRHLAVIHCCPSSSRSRFTTLHVDHYGAASSQHSTPSSPPRGPTPPPHTVACHHRIANLPPFMWTTMVPPPRGPQHRRRHRPSQRLPATVGDRKKKISRCNQI